MKTKHTGEQLLAAVEGVIREYGLIGMDINTITSTLYCPEYQGIDVHQIEVDLCESAYYCLVHFDDDELQHTARKVNRATAVRVLGKYLAMIPMFGCDDCRGPHNEACACDCHIDVEVKP